MIYCRLQPLVRSLILAVAVMLSSLGCKRDAAPSGERTPPNPGSPALYGNPTGTASTSIARSAALATTNDSWASNSFYVIHTELSPATLVHSSSRHLSLFSGMTNYGLGAPKFVAWATAAGPRTFKRGEKLDVSVMAEGWVLVWWAGAEGWTNWDCPWVVYLQHKPDRMSLDDDGLHLDFPKQAGDVVMLPVYGYEKLMLEGADYRATHKLPEAKVKVKTWEWPTVITRDPLTRIRYWAAVTREFPIYSEESFSVDRAKDTVTIRSKIQRRPIADDWRTRRIKLAPISPTLALAAKDREFPVRFSERWFDLEMPTPFGPYLGIEGVDEFDATFPVLHYINETESSPSALTNTNAGVVLALETIRKLAAHPDASLRTIHGAAWFAKALPYLEPEQRSNVIAQLRSFVRGETLASRDHAGVLEMLWAYAHFTGDWELVRERWPMVKQLFSTPRQMQWAGFGRSGDSSNGDAAAHCAAFARMAYKVGDMDSYHYASYAFARQLTTLAVRQLGAEYFREHQPWHSMELMDEEVFATGYQTDSGGWQLDGPKYPAQATTHLFSQRWERFNDADVARFYRECLTAGIYSEVHWLQQRARPDATWQNDPAGMPSLVQLRSLLLYEPDGSLAALAEDAPATGPASGQLANALSILRTSRATTFERLIPPGSPSSFFAGLEREDSVANSTLLVSSHQNQAGAPAVIAGPAWPQLTWPAWKTPIGARWTFGHIRASRVGQPTASTTLPLNWNSRVQSCGIPKN